MERATNLQLRLATSEAEHAALRQRLQALVRGRVDAMLGERESSRRALGLEAALLVAEEAEKKMAADLRDAKEHIVKLTVGCFERLRMGYW